MAGVNVRNLQVGSSGEAIEIAVSLKTDAQVPLDRLLGEIATRPDVAEMTYDERQPAPSAGRGRRRQLAPQVDDHHPSHVAVVPDRGLVPSELLAAQMIAAAVDVAVDAPAPSDAARFVAGRVGHERDDLVALECEQDAALPAER